MRTTLTIDDDVLAAAKRSAEREQRTVGEVLSTLARQGFARDRRSTRTKRNGIPLLSSGKGASPVTLGLVSRLRDKQP